MQILSIQRQDLPSLFDFKEMHMKTKLSYQESLLPWQPTLVGETLIATPLQESDYEALFAAASDPKIWEQHPITNRHTKPEFDLFFQSGIASSGALLVTSKASNKAIGSSRFVSHDPATSTVEIGWTFLICALWGTGANKHHAFQHVNCVEFFVGSQNMRSQAAVLKLGAKYSREVIRSDRRSIVYSIKKPEFFAAQF
jgi:N-acetyltransferase